MKAPRINLTIGSIVTDRRGLTRADVARAMETQLTAALEDGGALTLDLVYLSKNSRASWRVAGYDVLFLV